jgi:hypothetical protein
LAFVGIQGEFTPWLLQQTKTVKIYQITRKVTKWPEMIPNGRKIYQMDIKHLTTSSIASPSKIDPNLDFFV